MGELATQALPAVNLAVAAATLLYLVLGVSARIAVTEFKVDQLWRWYVRDRATARKDPDGNAAG